jgi:hypothetical protein
MSDYLDPTVATLVLVNTIVVALLLALLQSGESGYYARWGGFTGFAICFWMNVLLGILSQLGIPRAVSLVVWWAIALAVFKLTVRQAIKFNIATGFIYLFIVWGYALMFGERLS